MGRQDFGTVYTDPSATAQWRNSDWETVPWGVPPAYSTIPGFTLRMLSVDYMHTWNLGVCRDVVGSCIKLMASNKDYFPGETIQKRLNQILRSIKEFAAQRGKQISIKKLTKASLTWKAFKCPEFKASAYDSGVVLGWVVHTLSQQAPRAPWQGMVGVAWCGHNLSKLLVEGGVFLTEAECQQIQVVSTCFLNGYVRLASVAHTQGLFLWKVRPKYHFLQHLCEDCASRKSRRNPGHDSLWMDEDFVRFALKSIRKMNHKKASLNILYRNLVQVKQSLMKHV